MSHYIKIKSGEITLDEEDINIYIASDIMDEIFDYDSSGNVYLTINKKLLEELLKNYV